MKKKSSPKIISMKKNSWDQFLAKLAIFVSILMIVGGAIGMILVQKELQTSQDLRPQASIDNGQVSITTTSSNLGIGQIGTINFSINTSSVQTDGIQLTFNVVSDILPTPPVFTVLDSAPLQLAYSEIENTADGYLVSIIALPKQLGQSFATSTNTPFAFLDVTPSETGIITLNFDAENSISTVHASNPPTDELTHIATSEFVVGSTTIQASPTPEVSPISTPEISPTPEPTLNPGIGGTTVATCNESCSSNSDCDVNLRCYSGQCRLVTNVTSISCSSPVDQGLSFNCNEYCSDSNECSDGLICQSNSCRNPENISSTTCSNLTITQQSSIVKSCNESCSSNNECDANLRCYQGACRLATNPGSYSCSSSTKKTISKSVYGGTATLKGANDGSSKTGKVDPNKSIVGTVIIDSDKMIQKTAKTDILDKDGNVIGNEETALDVVKNYFMTNPKLPIILMGIGLGLITALLLLAFLKRKKGDDKPPMPPVNGGAPASGYEQNLQDKINSLKKESIQTRGVGTSIPPAMSPPITKMPIPQNTPIKNKSENIFSSQTRTSSMIDKIKNKDITPPSV